MFTKLSERRAGGLANSAERNRRRNETERLKRKIEKDHDYVRSITALAVPTEHTLKQNASIDVYEQYFKVRCMRDAAYTHIL